MIQVKTFFAFNNLRNFSYVIYDDILADAWVIDPFDADPIISFIVKSGFKLRGILNTHQHSDHIRGNGPLMEKFRVKPLRIKDKDIIPLADKYSIKSILTPGHTLDHQIFTLDRNNLPLALFSGDTLFNAGVGNCKGGGDVHLLYQSTIKLLRLLPDNVLLYPGHEYRENNLRFSQSVEPSNRIAKEALHYLSNHIPEELPPVTLGEEKLVNPFLRLDSEEIQEVLETSIEEDVFIKLRIKRDNW